jgi:hypothetical protein
VTTYRLPEALGYGQYEGDLLKDEERVRFDIDGVGLVDVPRAALIPVADPPEPAVGEFVATGTDGNLLPFYRRWSEGWFEVGGADQVTWTWAEICAQSRDKADRRPVRLIPDPFAEPVPLPWVDREITVTRTVPEGTFVFLTLDEGSTVDRTFVHLTNDRARDLARALWAAVDAVEAKS